MSEISIENKKSLYAELAELNEDPKYFLDLRLIKDEPNFEATIAFFCHDFLDYFALKDIVCKIKQAELVLLPMQYDAKNLQLRFYYNVLIRAINKDKIAWRMFFPNYNVDDFFVRQYTTLITRRPSQFFSLPQLIPLKKIFLLDSSLSILLTAAYATKGADTFLLPGPDEEYPFRHYAKTRILGIPRFAIPQNSSNNQKNNTQLLYIPLDLYGAEQFATFWCQIKLARQLAEYKATVILPALPHGNNLRQDQIRRYQKLIHILSQVDVEILHENDNPYQAVAQADILMLENGYFLFDVLQYKIPVILFERFFQKNIAGGRKLWEISNYRDFAFRDPQPFDIGVTLQKIQNLPIALDLINQKKDYYKKNLNLLKEKFLTDNQLEKMIDSIQEESSGPRPDEKFLTRTLEADIFSGCKL